MHDIASYFPMLSALWKCCFDPAEDPDFDKEVDVELLLQRFLQYFNMLDSDKQSLISGLKEVPYAVKFRLGAPGSGKTKLTLFLAIIIFSERTVLDEKSILTTIES